MLTVVLLPSLLTTPGSYFGLSETLACISPLRKNHSHVCVEDGKDSYSQSSANGAMLNVHEEELIPKTARHGTRTGFCAAGAEALVLMRGTAGRILTVILMS